LSSEYTRESRLCDDQVDEGVVCVTRGRYPRGERDEARRRIQVSQVLIGPTAIQDTMGPRIPRHTHRKEELDGSSIDPHMRQHGGVCRSKHKQDQTMIPLRRKEEDDSVEHRICSALLRYTGAASSQTKRCRGDMEYNIIHIEETGGTTHIGAEALGSG
jgi:hypothetical protein